jgi:hypothetical protein
LDLRSFGLPSDCGKGESLPKTSRYRLIIGTTTSLIQIEFDGNKISFCDYLNVGDFFYDIEGVFPSFDSKGVLLVPDPNQSQTRKGKSEGVQSKVLARCGRCNNFKSVLGQ